MNRSPLALAIAISLAPTLAAAQTLVLEEVIVTAQKKAETLTEAPVAVNLVSGDTIDELSIFQADELNKLVTGMEVRFEGDSRVGVGLRGVGTFQQQSAPARVGVYMDDYFMSSQATFALGSMFDMANVQILKGPQGTLYGQPSPTGAMILQTRDPNFDGVNGYVQGSYVFGPVGYNLQGGVNVPVIDDVLAFRVSGLTDDRETGLENVNPVNELDEERNRDGVRAKMLWNATDDLQVKLGYAYMESEDSDIYRAVETIKEGKPGYDPDANFKGIDADDREAIADNPSVVNSREESFYTLHVDWQIGDIDVSWFSGALDSQIDLIQDNDRTDIPSVVLAQDGHTGDDFGAYQHELRISGEAFDFWEWTFGGYYQESESQTDVVTSANRPQDGGVFDIVIDIPLDTETKAIFTHNTFSLTDDTDLVVGVRYNEFDQSDGTVLTGNFLLGAEMLPGGEITDPVVVLENVFPRPDCTVLGGVGSPPCLVGAGDFGWEEWTGTVKLTHHFSDALNAYVTLDRGFRPGAPNFDTSGIFSPDLTFYDGEKVNSIEIGAKGDLFDGRARYTAAVFYSQYEDYQIQAVGFTAYNEATGNVEIATNAPWVNVDEAVQQGVEADFRMQVTEAWMIYTSATYANVEFTDGEIPCTDPTQEPVGPDNRYNTCDADGEIASTQPEFTATFQTDYVWGNYYDGEAFVGGLWKFNGETETPGDEEGRLDTDSYSTLDLYTGLRAEGWSGQLFIKNALDDDGVITKRPLISGYNELLVTPPRTVGVTLNFNF